MGVRTGGYDNCFVEQKNDITVRQVVGYYRFTTDAEYQALQAVYTRLCPLLNYFYAWSQTHKEDPTWPTHHEGL